METRMKRRYRTRKYQKWLAVYTATHKAYEKERHARYYREHKMEQDEKKRAYRDQVRLECLARYGGARCVCCGEENHLFLTLDHKENGTGNKHRREVAGGNKLFAGYQFYLWLKRNHFPPVPLQVMCFNCNCGRNRNKGICPHKLLYGK